jgi:hypothetical protein
VGSVWFSRRAILLHLTVLVVVPGCVVAGWWQVTRALGGNDLSWAYTVEWPFFAGYGIYIWWKLVHERPGSPRTVTATHAQAEAGSTAAAVNGDRASSGGEVAAAAGAAAARGAGAQDVERALPPSWDDSDDPELAAYNRYLAELAASDKRRRR